MRLKALGKPSLFPVYEIEGQFVAYVATKGKNRRRKERKFEKEGRRKGKDENNRAENKKN